MVVVLQLNELKAADWTGGRGISLRDTLFSLLSLELGGLGLRSCSAAGGSSLFLTGKQHLNLLPIIKVLSFDSLILKIHEVDHFIMLDSHVVWRMR